MSEAARLIGSTYPSCYGDSRHGSGMGKSRLPTREIQDRIAGTWIVPR